MWKRFHVRPFSGEFPDAWLQTSRDGEAEAAQYKDRFLSGVRWRSAGRGFARRKLRPSPSFPVKMTPRGVPAVSASIVAFAPPLEPPTSVVSHSEQSETKTIARVELMTPPDLPF